jgi:hypothetical protein
MDNYHLSTIHYHLIHIAKILPEKRDVKHFGGYFLLIFGGRRRFSILPWRVAEIVKAMAGTMVCMGGRNLLPLLLQLPQKH